MDVRFNQNKHHLRWIERLCLIVGGSALLWCLFGYADMAFFQANGARQFEALRRSESAAQVKLVAGSVVGKLRIPRIGLSAMVVNGDDDKSLSHAVGHISGTSSPDTSGTVGLAGHRDTFFRSLGRMQNEDEIILETPSATYRYRVVRTAIVEPENVGVLRAVGQPLLVLVTCYPFHFIGRAPQRYVVTAQRTKIEVSPAHRY